MPIMRMVYCTLQEKKSTWYQSMNLRFVAPPLIDPQSALAMKPCLIQYGNNVNQFEQDLLFHFVCNKTLRHKWILFFNNNTLIHCSQVYRSYLYECVHTITKAVSVTFITSAAAILWVLSKLLLRIIEKLSWVIHIRRMIHLPSVKKKKSFLCVW